jgi:acyl dehydratase
MYAGPSCTITETDVVRFAALTEEFMGFHMDKEFAKVTVYARRVAHGLLGLPCMERLRLQTLSYVASTGSLGWNSRFRAPICMGDTITCHFRVAEERETKKPNRAIFILAVQLLKQGGEVFQKGEHACRIKCQAPLPLPAWGQQLRDDVVLVRCTHVIYSVAIPMGTRWRARCRSAVCNAPQSCTRSLPVPRVQGGRRSVYLPGPHTRAAGSFRGAFPGD